LRGIELSQARPDLPDRPLRATNAVIRDFPTVKRIYEQAGHAIAPVRVDIESRDTVMAAVDLTFEVGRQPAPPTASLASKTRRSTMDYLVESTVTVPDDVPPPEIEQRQAGETARVAELAAQGHVLRVWRPLPEDGPQRALGLYRVASHQELEAILDSLPLRP